jgi:hypothetical protein
MRQSPIEGDLSDLQKIHISIVNPVFDVSEGLFSERWRRKLVISLWMIEFVMLMILDWYRLNNTLRICILWNQIYWKLNGHAVCSDIKHFMN